MLVVSAATAAGFQSAQAVEKQAWHVKVAEAAQKSVETGPLKLLIPQGSSANVLAATGEFSDLSGVGCEVSEVPVDEINVEMIIRNSSGGDSFDVALPATFGLPDLVEAGAIEPLDEFAAMYEPADFEKGLLYRRGDFYQGKLYGYQTDGDAYMLFYNRQMLEDPKQQTNFLQLTGRPLQPARNWRELDEMMAFFHRPEQNQYGGCLFRNSGYLVWEWWARAHAKGIYPVADDMTPNMDSQAGITALQEMKAASKYQTPNARTNGLFENWDDFSKGNVFCNIGWGGTQKHLMSQPAMQNNLLHAPLPGMEKEGAPSSMGYFNWGWNYTVSSQSTRKELAYLLALFCVSPFVSTLAVRERDGYFDPFRESHYQDQDIERAYGRSFLDAHQQSMRTSIPDFYIRGQGKYIDALREQITLCLNGEISAEEAMQNCSKRWNHITRRLGIETQRQQWISLKKSYPDVIANAL